MISVFQKQEILENTSDINTCVLVLVTKQDEQEVELVNPYALKVRSYMIIVEHFKNTVYLNGWTQRKLA